MGPKLRKSVNLVYMYLVFFNFPLPPCLKKWWLCCNKEKNKRLVNNKSIYVYIKFFGYNFSLFRGCYSLKLWSRRTDLLPSGLMLLNELESFYSCVPKIKITWWTVPEIQSETDNKFFCNFGSVFQILLESSPFSESVQPNCLRKGVGIYGCNHGLCLLF